MEVTTTMTGVSTRSWDATEPVGLAVSHFPSKAAQHEGEAFPCSENKQSGLNPSASLMEPKHGWHILKNSA